MRSTGCSRSWLFRANLSSTKNRGTMFFVDDIRTAEQKQRDVQVFHGVAGVQRTWQRLAVGNAPSASQLSEMNPRELCHTLRKFAETEGSYEFFKAVAHRAIERVDDFEVIEALELLECFSEHGVLNDDLCLVFGDYLDGEMNYMERELLERSLSVWTKFGLIGDKLFAKLSLRLESVAK